MTRFVTSFRLLEYPASALALLAGAGLVLAPPLAAQTYGSKISNNMSLCEAGKGPAIWLDVTGLKSGDGNLFVRTYYARSSDWLKSKRYIHRIDTKPRKGSMSVCVPLPAAGAYAITVQHDVNGNRDTDLSVDGAGVSNNPAFGSFLGIVPRPPSVDKARFTAGSGITRMSITVRYK